MKVYSFYSNIMTVANFFQMTPLVNTALYLSNILCFFGHLLFYVTNPLHLGFLTRDIPFMNMVPTNLTNMLNHVWHALPVYLFRNRQTLADTFSVPSILLATFWYTCYIVFISETVLMENYERTTIEMLGLWYFFSALIVLVSMAKKLQ